MLIRIKELRMKAHMSQKQLADVIQVSQQSINKYENHNVQPDLSTLVRLADFFHVSVDYIIGYSDIPSPISNEDSFNTPEFQWFAKAYAQLTEEQRLSIQIIIKNYIALYHIP